MTNFILHCFYCRQLVFLLVYYQFFYCYNCYKGRVQTNNSTASKYAAFLVGVQNENCPTLRKFKGLPGVMMKYDPGLSSRSISLPKHGTVAYNITRRHFTTLDFIFHLDDGEVNSSSCFQQECALCWKTLCCGESGARFNCFFHAGSPAVSFK